MLLLDTMTDISIYQIALILKYGLNIVLTIVPLIVIVMCMIDIFKIVINPNDYTKSLKTVVNRLLSGLIVFFIPSLISFAFTVVESYDDTTMLKYYNDASLDKIKALKIQYDKEVEADKAKRKAELKAADLKRQEEERKKNEQIEKIKQEAASQNGGTSGGGSYSGDSVSSGSYGSVRFENGVFYIPNQRATSESDIPRQSGEYGLNPVFWERLSALINDAASQGHKVTVTSGWRSYSTQRSLWDRSSRPCSERARWTSCPGGSRHGFGIAADLKFNGSSCSGGWDCNAAASWVHANAGKYGLKFRMSWEPWHIEPDNVQGGNFGSCNASC